MLSRINPTPQERGFTLVELLVTVAIVAILASIAYPSYQNQVRETQRRQAIAQVLELSQRLEKIRAQTYSYAAGDGLSEVRERYTISSDVANDGISYTITATPDPASDQVSDRCGSFSFSSNGTWTFANGHTYTSCR